MEEEINWELYRSFMWALKEGSLSAAARASGSTQPTIGRHIATLEKALNLTLFIRSKGGLVPTKSALALKPYAESLANTASALLRAATEQGSGIQGVVRITATDVIGVEVLPDILAKLRQQYPQLTVELMLSDRFQDLLQNEADIAIRMSQPTQAQLIARSVGNITVGLHASRDYTQRNGIPTSFNDLLQHGLIGFDKQTEFIRSIVKSIPQLAHLRFNLKADSNIAQLSLIRAGAGIGFCQVPIGRHYDLVPILPSEMSVNLHTWITMHEDLRHNPSSRVVFDALVQGMSRYIKGEPVSENNMDNPLDNKK